MLSVSEAAVPRRALVRSRSVHSVREHSWPATNTGTAMQLALKAYFYTRFSHMLFGLLNCVLTKMENTRRQHGIGTAVFYAIH